jgi:hypothetical protein
MHLVYLLLRRLSANVYNPSEHRLPIHFRLTKPFRLRAFVACLTALCLGFACVTTQAQTTQTTTPTCDAATWTARSATEPNGWLSVTYGIVGMSDLAVVGDIVFCANTKAPFLNSYTMSTVLY